MKVKEFCEKLGKNDTITLFTDGEGLIKTYSKEEINKIPCDFLDMEIVDVGYKIEMIDNVIINNFQLYIIENTGKAITVKDLLALYPDYEDYGDVEVIYGKNKTCYMEGISDIEETLMNKVVKEILPDMKYDEDVRRVRPILKIYTK